MKKNFTVFGCCASRDVFNSQINFNYKDFFTIGNDAFHTSMISLMSNPVSYKESSINEFEGEITEYNLGLIKKDFDKSYLDDLKEDNYDYMVLDTYFDVRHGVIRLNDQSTYITNTPFVHQTDFFKSTSNKNIITIKNDFNEYLELWTSCCDKFFNYVEEHCPNMKIILNPVRSSTEVIDNGDVFVNESYNRFIPNHCYRSILDEYILNNFDVDVLIFDKKHYLDANYFFGQAEIHYHYSYYEDATNQLNKIISKNDDLDFNLNNEIRILKRKLLLHKLNEDIGLKNQDTIFSVIEKLSSDDGFNMEKLNSDIVNYWNEFFRNGYNKYHKQLNRFAMARLDIKNLGSEFNDLALLEVSDSNSLVLHPPWLKDNDGAGILVQSDVCSLEMKIKCINDGEVQFTLRGPDFKDKNRNRFPFYVDYTSLKINGEEYIHENLLAWMEKPYVISKKVIDSEILDVKIEWMPLNSSRLL